MVRKNWQWAVSNDQLVMGNWQRRICLLLVFWITAVSAMAQIDAFATAKLNRREVFPEQPIKATITVSTATWFTQPLDFDNIQVANAFVLPFKRTQSAMRQINGKKYASLEFYFLIFPYETGDYQFPSLNIRMETPPVGDYKGAKAAVSTQAVDFRVKDIPEAFEDKDWFIAKSVNLSETWNRPLDGLRIGDVLQRNITIRANGTLPNFIPELLFDELDFASIYPKTPKLTDRRSTTDANGTRVETVVYLLEEEGSFEIPPIRVEWWDPYRQQVYFKELPSQTIAIQDNPDLGMLRSLKDSLDVAAGVPAEQVGDEGPITILGFLWWQFAVLLLAIFFLMRLLIVLGNRWWQMYKAKLTAYQSSEGYYFRQIQKTKDPVALFNRTYEWWDRFSKTHELNPSLAEALKDAKETKLLQIWENLDADLFYGEKHLSSYEEAYALLRSFREQQILKGLRENKSLPKTQLAWK